MVTGITATTTIPKRTDLLLRRVLNSRIYKYIGRASVKYLDVRLVLAMDVFLSVLASCVVYGIAVFILDWDILLQLKFRLVWLISSAVASALSFLVMRTYTIIIRHTEFRDIIKFLLALGLKAATMAVLMLAFLPFSWWIALMLSFDVLVSILLLTAMRLLMIVFYNLYKSKVREIQKCRRVLLYGVSDKSAAAVSRFKNSSHYSIVGVITPNPSLHHTRFADKTVYYCDSEAALDRLSMTSSSTGILFTAQNDVKLENNRLLRFAGNLGLKTFILPEIGELDEVQAVSSIRNVRVEDLLARDEIRISMPEVLSGFSGKTVLVTGAAGSIGSELCRQLSTFGISKLILFDNAETPMHNLRLELEDSFPGLDFVPVIGDVRLERRLDFTFRHYRPDVVFHAAAYKHVPLMEENPCESMLVNFIGTGYVAEKCVEYGVEKLVMISTDKAVNPTNIMGCSKRLAEIYVQSLGLAIEKGERQGKTKFVTTRFGNVLGSNGSVIPRFREQIAKGGPLTVTHPEITRFFMTIPEACRLVMEAAVMDTANRICVFDMGEPVRIDSLARRMIELSGFKVDKDIRIEYTGLRPGEKLFEEVLSNEENTDPTMHGRIRIAKVRTYAYSEAVDAVERLGDYARNVKIPEMVRLMKQIVPEFISKNSKFSEYDEAPLS